MGSASGPASPVLSWWGRSVGNLGPGLTSESADAARVVLRNDLSAGPQVFLAPTGGACLICPSWTRGRGSQVRRPAGACHPFNLRKEMALTIVETRAITGGVDTHADVHVAAALDPVGGLLGVEEFPATPAGYARLLEWLGGFGTVVPGRDRGHRQLRRRPGPPRHHRRRPASSRSTALTARTAAGGQVRPPRCRQRRPGRAVRPGPRRAEGPRRRRRGDPGADGRQAQRPLRADPDDQPGPGPGP